MIIGKQNLTKLFPTFKEDIAQNGIDLRVGKIYKINTEQTIKTGAVNDKKYKPKYTELIPVNNEYQLMPHVFYFISIDRPISIPENYVQTYKIRSTFGRSGVLLISSVGDSGFTGTLMMGLVNTSPIPVSIGENERVIQALTHTTDGTCDSYNGVYQQDKFYK